MDQFSQQLARLQSAASRAGGGRAGGGRDDDSRGRGRGGRSGDSAGTDGSRNDHHRRRHGGRYDGGGGRRHGDGGSHGERHGRRHYDDRGRECDRSPPWKRGRHDDGNGEDRFGHRHGGGGRGRDGHRGGRGRDDSGTSGGGTEVPLAQLVKAVAGKYAADTAAKSDTDGTPAGGPPERRRTRHIALLFLTIDDLPHEHIWKCWLESDLVPDPCEKAKASTRDETPENSKGEVDEDASPIVSVICHAKFPERIKSEWLRARHLLRRDASPGETTANGGEVDNTADGGAPRFHSRRPSWGSVEITKAMVDLVEEGLRIGDGSAAGRRYLATAPRRPDDGSGTTATASTVPPVDRFVFVSESCLPAATLREFGLALFGPAGGDGRTAAMYDKSWVNARSSPNNGYARQLQWDAIRPCDIPPGNVWKADQWMVLNRVHAEAVAAMPGRYLGGRELWSAMRRVRASDEMYFPTALSVLGILHRPSDAAGVEVDENSRGESCAGNGVRRRRVTFCDWSMGAKNPASFTAGDWAEVARRARNDGCLIVRKFVRAGSLPGGGQGEDDGLVTDEDWTAAFAPVAG